MDKVDTTNMNTLNIMCQVQESEIKFYFNGFYFINFCIIFIDLKQINQGNNDFVNCKQRADFQINYKQQDANILQQSINSKFN